ncbi:MAG: hypothetical protein HYU36_15385 [Planctomycetes bacterium]|nr:hypothetical protein [Planctomycetota bacterium]
MTPKPPSHPSPSICSRCARLLQPGCGDFYVVRIEAVADPTPPDLSEEDLAVDFEREMERLIAEAEKLSEQEMMDQVCRRMTLFLCTPCYRLWIENPTG